MNVEDSTPERVPQSLEAVVNEIRSHENEDQDTFKKDLMFSLILVLCYENGFVLFENNTTNMLPLHVHIDKLLTQCKSTPDVFECYLVLSGFESIPAKLVMTPLGSIAIINGVIEKFNQETYSICLPLSRYIPLPRATKVPMIFRDLLSFSFILKNKIITPLKSKILSHHGYPSASLVGLPEEVLQKIALYLPLKKILNLSEICSKLFDVLNSESIWHELYKRDFDSNKALESECWKEAYKAKYKQKTESERSCNRSYSGTLHDFMEYSDLVSYVDNPYWDII